MYAYNKTSNEYTIN